MPHNYKTTRQLAEQWGYDSQFINKVARREKLGQKTGTSKTSIRLFSAFDEERMRKALERNSIQGRHLPRYTENIGVSGLPAMEETPEQAYNRSQREKKAARRKQLD